MRISKKDDSLITVELKISTIRDKEMGYCAVVPFDFIEEVLKYGPIECEHALQTILEQKKD